jgi:hypothetical protein
MTINDIKESSLTEIKELLELNTKDYRYNLELMETAYVDVYSAFMEHRNSLLERRMLWHVILMVFYGFDLDIISAIEDKMNWYDFTLWCEDAFINSKEIQFFITLYTQYRKDKNSAMSIMLELVDVLSGAINDMSPESIQTLLDQLGDNLENLPDIIKNSL